MDAVIATKLTRSEKNHPVVISDQSHQKVPSTTSLLFKLSVNLLLIKKII